MKSLATLAAILAASALAAATITAPPGTDNIAFGYRAATGATGANTNVVVIGTEAAANSANNTNCVFIGANAGSGMSRMSGAVVIGDGVFVHTNGVTTIKGYSGGGGSAVLPQYWAFANVTNASGEAVGANDVSALPATLGQEGYEYSVNDYVDFTQGLKASYGQILANDFGIYSGSGTYGWTLSTAGTYIEHLTAVVWDGQYSPPEGAFLNKTTDSSSSRSVINYGNSSDNIIHELATGENRMHFSFENGGFAVYTNGVKAGTLTFTPATP